MRSALTTRSTSSSAFDVRPRRNARHARKRFLVSGSGALLLALCLPSIALAVTCNNASLKGRYTFAASGFTRPPGTGPGFPWSPKAVLEVLRFDGLGGVTTPLFTAANPFGDLGNIIQTTGAPGTYTIQPDCTGVVAFTDQNATTFTIHLGPYANVVYMIQTNPPNNVFEGIAKRSW